MAITRSTRRPSAHVAGCARRLFACWPSLRAVSKPAPVSPFGVAGLAVALIGVPQSVAAQAWKLTPSLTFESTLTDNVNLAPNDQRKADWVNQFTPALRFA